MRRNRTAALAVLLSAVLPVAGSIAAGLAIAALDASAARADQRDPRLDDLFARLHAARGAENARMLESEIWAIWTQSEDADVERLMKEGVEQMNAGALDSALRAFDAITLKAPDFAEGWNKRATVLYLMGDYAASMKDVARTLELEPRHFGALSGLGLINAELGNDAAALAAFEKALAINPSMAGARQNAEDLRHRLEGRAI
jgi:tetratricopeptide (TPR) repeat protein